MKKILIEFKWLLWQSRRVMFPLLLIIVLGSISSLIDVFRAIVTKILIDSATIGDSQLIIKWLIIFASILCVEIGIRAVNPIITTYCSGKIKNIVQKKLYTHITHSEWMEQTKYHSVSLLTRITNDVDTIANTLTNVLPNIISFSVMLITAFITLLFLEPIMALLAIVIFPFCLLISKIYARKQKRVYLDIQEEEVNYRTYIQESLQNIMIVKAFTQETNNISKLKKFQNKKLKLLLKRSRLNAITNTFIQIGAWVSYFIVFLWGTLKLSTGINAFGTLTALLQLFGNIQGPFLGFAHSLPQIINSLAAAERLMEIEEMVLEQGNNLDISKNIQHVGIEFKNVSFCYKDNIPVLNNICFKIDPGDIVALIGDSGEGKTTIIRLLLALIHPIDGEINFSFNNKDFTGNRDFRNLISYVPQGNTLFSGTIKDNVHYGNPQATLPQIKEALKLACAWGFIDELENKHSTVIGEKGIGLSEGQAQRLAIARAFLRKRPILILDEATSALDSETELGVLQSIKNLNHKPTCFIITHRTSALAICNKTLQINNGHITIIDNTSNTTESVI